MTWRVEQKPNPQGKDDDGRDMVTDGVEFFHVDRDGAQRLVDLLNAGSEEETEEETEEAEESTEAKT